MVQLNKIAADVMQQFDVHACTDVTGFGLLGHLKELTVGSKVKAALYVSQIPFIDQARELAAAGIAPGGTLANIDYVQPYVQWENTISETEKILLCDAQTSGGLIIAVSRHQAEEMLASLKNQGVSDAAFIGEIAEIGNGTIDVNR
jgi:selenide,water dikinase